MSTPTFPEREDRTPVPPPTPGSAPQTSGLPAGSPEPTPNAGEVSGQHAANRPYPPSAGQPAGSGDPAATAAMPVAAPLPAPDEEQLAGERRDAEERRLVEERRLAEDREVQGRHADAPSAADAREAEAARESLPEAPPKPGLGRHLLGILLGLVLTPVALLLTGIGTARLADVVSAEDAVTDPLGLTLLVLGVVLLAIIVLLGAWSPAVPITGGIVWGIGLGVAFLVVPDVMRDTLERMSADQVIPGGVEQLAEVAMSGTLLVTGTLLLAAGIAAARARRRGRRWAEGVAVAEAARLDARGSERRAR